MTSRALGDSPEVSVIVPAYRAARTLPACLEAISRSELAPAEVLVVQDGPDDPDGGAAARVIAEHGARLLTLPRRSGPAAARNAGAAGARGGVLVFVDADVAPAPAAIRKLVAALDAGPDVAASFGSYDAAPPERNVASQYKNLLHHYVHQQGREEAETFWAGLGAMRRSAFEAHGGFDAVRYPASSIEDVELGRRLREGGARIRLVKDAQGTHLKRWTARSVFVTDLFRRALPWSELILRSRFLQSDLNLTGRHRAGVLATGLALACFLVSPIDPLFALAGGAATAAALAAGSDVLAFLSRARGPALAVAAAPLHLAYYLACGLGFALAAARNAARRDQPAGDGSATGSRSSARR